MLFHIYKMNESRSLGVVMRDKNLAQFRPSVAVILAALQNGRATQFIRQTHTFEAFSGILCCFV